MQQKGRFSAVVVRCKVSKTDATLICSCSTIFFVDLQLFHYFFRSYIVQFDGGSSGNNVVKVTTKMQ